jgi:acetyltransferase
LAVITNAGGPGIMATDALIGKGGKLAKLNQKTFDVLDKALPPFWSHGNPIDVLGDAKADRYKAAVEACLNDDNIDGILIIFTQQAVSEPIEIAKTTVELVKSKTYQNKTILTSFMGYGPVEEANHILNSNNIPTYSTPEQAIKTYLYMYQYQRNLEMIYETPEELPIDATPPKRPIMVILRNAALENRELLTEDEAKKLLYYYNFPIATTKVATSSDEAVTFAHQIGYPVVLKILSPQITHKTDAGGVVLNLHSDDEVREAYNLIMQNVKNYDKTATVIGVTVQRMIKEKGTEVIIGGKTDPIFGPIILFGMGGVGVELFKDYSIGLPPLNTTLIRRMMEETKVYQLLKGYRNIPPSNLKLLEETLLLFSQLLIDFPQLKEIDINPLLINEKEACILDARIAFDKEKVFKKFEPHEHMVISPYPVKYETFWRLKNGREIILRPIKPEDEPMWLEMFQSFSEESIRYRFFQMLKDTSHELRVRYCNVDYDREIAIVAELNEAGRRKILGVGRLSTEPDGKSGELAFIIVDEWQGLGLGTKIVDYVLEIAKEKGIEKVFAIMLTDNCRALSLTRKMGFKQEYLSDGTVKGTLSLKEELMSMECPQPNHYPLDKTEEEKEVPNKETKSEQIKSEAGMVQQ